MGNIKHIAITLTLSLLILAGIGYWVDSKNEPIDTSLSTLEDLEAPLSPEALQANNPEITNTMNRTAVFTTNKGVIKLELFEDKMPITTGNFVKLAQEGYYNGTKFHRVIDGFMIQGGDPNTKTDNTMSYGTGGPGYTIQDEFVADPLLTNVRGTIAMANTGQPNSGGSQFFINTVDNTGLDFDKEPLSSRHPVFGRVIDGMDIVDAISSVSVGARDLPVEPVVIETLTIE
jgi:cyclophilin family peptidyl-prolyl cis-trans isomerase